MNGINKDIFFPSTIFLLNLIVGLLFINEGLFHMDSVALAMAVEKTYQTGVLQPAVLGRFGAVVINSILYWPFYLLGTNAEFVTRFSSVLFHALSVLAFYFMIKRFFGDRIQALFGALLLSFTPLFFNPNTYGKEHGMGIFFLLSSFVLLHKGVQKGSPGMHLLASLCYLTAISVRESQLSTLPLFILLFFSPEITWRPLRIRLPEGRLSWGNLFLFFAPLVTILTLMTVSYLLESARGAELHQILKPTFIPAVNDLLNSSPMLVFPFLFLGMVQMAIKKEAFWNIFFILWLLLILVHGCTKWYTPRFMDIVLIPMYVFCSFSLRELYERSQLVALSVAIVCAAGMFLYSYPMLSFRHAYNGEMRVAKFVAANTEPEALIVTVDQFPFIQYYGNRKTAWLPIAGTPEAIEIFLNKVNTHFAEGKPVYYTDSPYLKGYEASSLYTIQQYYDIELLGGVLSEDYHRPELRFRFCFQKLYRVTPKVNDKRLSQS